ncbi:hypothetical protein CBS101457_006094 [Exobasidium rhododendri]|nr:hypothetical protein CBS101457_006094 [Exobasidium rhododendri]
MKRVDVSIGVMSLCPDALYFENAFSRTIEQVNKKINLSLHYIATQNKSAPYGASCKHGDEECQGDIQQLCVIDALKGSKAGKRYDLSPSDAQRLWWDFVQCENSFGGLKRIGQESLVKQCLGAIGGVLHWEEDGIQECCEGPRGKQLLIESLEEVEKRKISNSATLQIEGETICVRDNAQWKQCSNGHDTSDWVKQIEEAYRQKNAVAVMEDGASPTSASSHFLYKRQGPLVPAGNNTSNAQPSPTNGNDRQGAPLSVFTFIIAIALFILVVSFVLLRIFLRNRRLRRLGIYPEGPIDRLLGGTIREHEDTLAPPRLWEAKIADVRGGSAEEDFRAEKSALGGGVGAGDVKQNGWDALMPVSAALPPNLYPIIYDTTDSSHNPTDGPPTYPPPNYQHARIGRHMPQFLRRQTGEGEGGNTAAAQSTGSNVPASGIVNDEFSSPIISSTGERTQEKLAASVNITVLIAMPSPKTVFPSGRRTGSQQTKVSQRNARQNSTSMESKLEEVQEGGDDQDGSSVKGKAKRAASLRSVKSTVSTHSVAEARREAFFNQVKKDDESSLPISNEAPPYREESYDDEELPELMFGTASVPIFARSSAGDLHQQNRVPLTKLTQPTRADILSLMSSAAQAKEDKADVALAAAKKLKKQEDGDLEGNRRSMADTSIEGEGMSSFLGNSHDRSADESHQPHLGDVATRMMRSSNEGDDLEMNDMGSSRNERKIRRSVEVNTPNTMEPLMLRATSPGRNETPTREYFSGRYNAGTPSSDLMTPSSSMPLTATESQPFSMTSWHTGIEDDAQAARAIAERDVDIATLNRRS